MITDITISDITGRQVKSLKFKGQSKNYNINVEDLPTGLKTLRGFETLEGLKDCESRHLIHTVCCKYGFVKNKRHDDNINKNLSGLIVEYYLLKINES